MPILPHLLGNTAPSAPSEDSLLGVITELYAEFSLVKAEGFNADNDEVLGPKDITRSAAAYFAAGCSSQYEGTEALDMSMEAEGLWPYEPQDFNPSQNPERNYLKACALLIAEILRLRRGREAAAPAAVEMEEELHPQAVS